MSDNDTTMFWLVVLFVFVICPVMVWVYGVWIDQRTNNYTREHNKWRK